MKESGYTEALLETIAQAVKSIESEAYKRGIREGAARLEFWAPVVPETISKVDLLESLKREAQALRERC